MNRDTQLRFLDRLLAARETQGFEGPGWQSSLAVDAYLSPARLEAERRQIFGSLPIAVGRGSEIADAGATLTTSIAGKPVVVVRDEQRRARAFLNACRHRGARVCETQTAGRKRLTCPYHAWSYDLSGHLVHVPRRECFPALDPASSGLVELPAEERHGYLWVIPTPGAPIDVRGYLGDLDQDLAGLNLGAHTAFQKVTRRGGANWKLLIEAFLEGYHARFLHQRTLARFFSDEVVFDFHGPHVRSCGARAELKALSTLPREGWDLRAAATLFYFLFPNTILVFHPDWITSLSVFPESLGELSYTHTMLVAPGEDLEAKRTHLEKSFQLIEETVFAREDLAIAESVQQTLQSGANTRFQVGNLERPLWAFHQSLEAAIGTG